MSVALVVWLADGEQEHVEVASEGDYAARWLPAAQRLNLPLLTSLGDGDVVQFEQLEALAVELGALVAAAPELHEPASALRAKVNSAMGANVVDAFVG